MDSLLNFVLLLARLHVVPNLYDCLFVLKKISYNVSQWGPVLCVFVSVFLFKGWNDMKLSKPLGKVSF